MRTTITAEYVKEFEKLGVNQRTTWEELWQKIGDSLDIEASIHVELTRGVVEIFKGDEKLGEWDVARDWFFTDDKSEIDLNKWHHVLVRAVMENNLWRKSKKKKTDTITMPHVKLKEAKKEPVATPTQIKTRLTKEVTELKRKRDNLGVRISDYKKKGRPIEDLLVERDQYREQITMINKQLADLK